MDLDPDLKHIKPPLEYLKKELKNCLRYLKYPKKFPKYKIKRDHSYLLLLNKQDLKRLGLFEESLKTEEKIKKLTREKKIKGTIYQGLEDLVEEN